MTHLEEVKAFFSSKSAENIATWLDELFRAIHANPEQYFSAALAPMGAWYRRNDSYLDDLAAMCRESLLPEEQEKFNHGIGVLLQRYASRHDIPRELIEDAVDLIGRLPAFEASESLFILLRDRGHAMPFLWYDALSSFATLSPASEIIDPLRKMVDLEGFPANFAIYAFQYLCEAKPSEWYAHWNLVLPKLESLAEMAHKEYESTQLEPVYDFAAELLVEKVSQYLAESGKKIDLTNDEILSEVVMRLPEPMRDKIWGEPITIPRPIRQHGQKSKRKSTPDRQWIKFCAAIKNPGVPSNVANRALNQLRAVELRTR